MCAERGVLHRAGARPRAERDVEDLARACRVPAGDEHLAGPDARRGVQRARLAHRGHRGPGAAVRLVHLRGVVHPARDEHEPPAIAVAAVCPERGLLMVAVLVQRSPTGL